MSLQRVVASGAASSACRVAATRTRGNGATSRRLFSLATNSVASQLPRHGLNTLRNNGIQPMTVISSTRRNAHALPKFEWERKRREFTPEILEKRVSRIKNLATEAQLCIEDCHEAVNTEHFEEELQSACNAVDNAELAYSELLEELASHDCVQLLNEVRKMHASEGIWAELRNSLEELKKMEGGEVAV